MLKIFRRRSQRSNKRPSAYKARSIRPSNRATRGLDQQAQAIAASIDSLVKQRVQLDAHISRLESQMEDIKKSAQTNLSRQIKQYNEDLGGVKQQLSSLVARQATQASQKINEPAKPPAAPGPAGK